MADRTGADRDYAKEAQAWRETAQQFYPPETAEAVACRIAARVCEERAKEGPDDLLDRILDGEEGT